MYDLILKGGRIYDGSGMPSFIGDVAINNGRIEEIGRISASADRVLDVGGLAVAPVSSTSTPISMRSFGGIRWHHRRTNTASPPS